MSRIPDHIVGEILDKTDALSVVGEKVRLVKRGGRWWGLCPFHAEKTPSFSVDADRGLFYCFGCHKGGSVVEFLMEVDRLSYRETLEELAARAGVVIPEGDRPEGDGDDGGRHTLLELHERLAGTFHWMLLNHPGAARARDILAARRVPGEILEAFRIGYSPADTSWLHDFLLKKSYSPEFLLSSGLFSRARPRYPIFADRIMFPIADHRGRVVAFGGRIIDGEGPKYLNSPETLIFRKQSTLFGLDRSSAAIRKEGAALVCEGYMDVLSFHAAGIGTAVAPLGTAFTEGQARQLKRLADRVLLCFDSDEAGRKATERACALCAASALDAEIVSLGEGKDASEILEKQGAEALKKTLASTINGGDFLIGRAKTLFDVGTVDGKSRAVAYLFPYIDALDSRVKKDSFIESAARGFGVGSSSIGKDMESMSKSHRGPDSVEGLRNRSGKEEATNAARTGELVFVAALVLDPKLYPGYRESLSAEDLEDPRARILLAALERACTEGNPDTSSVLDGIADQSLRGFVHAIAASGEVDLNTERIVSDGYFAVKRRSLERRMQMITARMHRSGSGAAGDDVSVDELLYEKMKLDCELAQLKGEVDERS